MPYDTVYVLNEEVYINQAKRRTEYFRNMYTDELVDNFSKSASPEIFLELISSTIGYYENRCELSPNIPEDTKRFLMEFISQIDFSKCDNIENLRYISTVIDSIQNDKLNTANLSLFNEISRKCKEQLSILSKTRDFSMTEAVNKCLEELNQVKQASSHDMMLDFIESEIELSKEKEIFSVGENLQEKIENQDIERKKQEEMARKNNSTNIQRHSSTILKRQELLKEIYRKLNLESNQENFEDIAYKLSGISRMVEDSEGMIFDKSCEISKKILESEEYRRLATECMENQTKKFNEAIKEKIKSLIHEDEIKQIDEKLEQITSEKIGFFGRILGKKKYFEAVKEMLELEKKEKELDTYSSLGKVTNLIDYVNENGMSKEIQSFISNYLTTNLGISDDEKKILEEALKLPIREKKTYPVVTSPKDYKRCEANIRLQNKVLVADLEERQSFGDNLKPNSRITTSTEIKHLRQYVDSVHSLAKGNYLSKEIEEKTESLTKE